MAQNSNYNFIEGPDYILGTGGPIPKFSKNGKYVNVARRIPENGWVQVTTLENAKSMQAAIRRVGFMTKIRRIEEKGLTFWRVWKVQSMEEFHALQKQGTKKKVLSTRKGRKNKQRNSEPLGESYGQQEVAGTQEEVPVEEVIQEDDGIPVGTPDEQQ